MNRPLIGWMRLRALAALVAMLWTSQAWAASYHVSPTGSDTASCTQMQPCRQIRKAATLAKPGDTILVADGQYLGFTLNNLNGQPGAPITVLAQGAGAQVLPTTDRSDNRDNIFITYSSHLVLDGLRSANAPRAGVRIDNSQHITVRRGTFTNNGTWGIFTDYSDDLLLESNECAFSGKEHGIYVSNSGDRPVIRFNTAHGNNASGIQINADPAQLEPSLGTRGDGITEQAVVEGNIIFNNGTIGGAAINLASVRNSRIVNNLLYHNRAGGIAGWDDGVGDQWGSKDNQILHNTVYFRAGEGRWCVSLKNGSTGNVIKNNILFGGRSGALEFDNPSPLQADSNILFRQDGITQVVTNEDTGQSWTLAQWRSAGGNDLQSISSDPLFVNRSTAPVDFHLQPGSPAIDKGAMLVSVTTDLENNQRPNGLTWDMGAYEAAGTGTPPPTPAPTPTPLPADTTKPVISGVTVDAAATTATISWTTDEPTTGLVAYGPGPTSTVIGDAERGTAHSVTLSGLTAATSYQLVITATDAAGNSATSARSFTTQSAPATNRLPTAQPDTATTVEDTTVMVPVLANDSDPDGDPLTITGASGASRGSCSVSGGQIHYQPAANASGNDQCTYAISDGRGAAASAILTLTIAPVNDAPTAALQVAVTGPLAIQADASGSSDVDDMSLQYAWSFGDGTSGSSMTAGHIYTAAGAYTVTVTVTDAAGASRSASTSVQVTASAPSPTPPPAASPTPAPSSGNAPPVVNAGRDRRVRWGTVITLEGEMTDDGLPEVPGRVTVKWSRVKGPSHVGFLPSNRLRTRVAFPKPGVYVLRLKASDGELNASDTVTITVVRQDR